eukprot:1141398-Pelagomonas_calceolata.AAC.1
MRETAAEAALPLDQALIALWDNAAEAALPHDQALSALWEDAAEAAPLPGSDSPLGDPSTFAHAHAGKGFVAWACR